MKRAFDLFLAVLLMVVGIIPMALMALLVKLTSKGPVLYWSDRIGRNNRVFSMPKFRTMRIDSPEVASHLLANPTEWLTPVGGLFRRASLDELPQLWSILRGDMSFVGPRPALHNQDDLIALRTLQGVHGLIPGLTGWAQINGRDEAPIPHKVALDAHYLRHRSFGFDLKIILLTFLQVVRAKGTSVPNQLQGLDQGDVVPAEAFLALADVWFDQKDYDRSIAAYDRTLAITPRDAVARNNRGAAWAAKGKPEKAVVDLAAALALNPRFPTALHNRGCAWTMIGETDKADRDFRRAYELISETAAASETVIQHLTSRGRDRRRDAHGAILLAACSPDFLGSMNEAIIKAVASPVGETRGKPLFERATG